MISSFVGFSLDSWKCLHKSKTKLNKIIFPKNLKQNEIIQLSMF